MATKIQIRRDTAANWASVDPIPGSGEFCLDEDTGEVKMGDGATAHSLLPVVFKLSGGVLSVNGASGDVALTADDLLGAGSAGGAASVSARIGTISNFASPNAGGIIAGHYYDNNPHGGVGTLTFAANRLTMAPYYTSIPLSVDEIGVACSTLAAGVLGKVVIYGTGPDGWPDPLLYEGADLDMTTTGFKGIADLFDFDSGVQYWLGLRQSGGTARVRSIAVANAYNLGLGTNSGSATQATVLQRTVTYADPAPNPWVFDPADLTNNVTPPSIRFKAAA